MHLPTDPMLLTVMAAIQVLALLSLALAHIFGRTRMAVYADVFFFACLAMVGASVVLTVKLGGPLFLSCAIVLTIMAVGGSFSMGKRTAEY